MQAGEAGRTGRRAHRGDREESNRNPVILASRAFPFRPKFQPMEEALNKLGAVLAVVWAVVRGEEAGWTSVEVLAPAAAGVALLACFALWERRAPYPPRMIR